MAEETQVYGQQKESSLRRGPGSAACTARAGRGSAAQGARLQVGISLVLHRISCSSKYQNMPFTKLVNVSLMSTGTRILIKSCLGGTAVSPLLPTETPGALEIQLCSHHAKMQRLWH